MGGHQDTQSISERIGTRMQKARQEARGGRGYTQPEMAELLGVSSVTLSRWETGARRPSFEILEQFAKEVEKPLSYFFEEEPRQDEFSQALLRITDKLGQADREDILEYARYRYERWYKGLDPED